MSRQLKKSEDSKVKKESLVIQSYSGVIPPPNVMEGYEKVLSGSADRILTMAENDLKHRHNLEAKEQENIVECRNKVLNSEISNFKRGQYFGFIVMLISLLSGFYLVLTGQTVGGYSTLVTTVLFYFSSVMYRNKIEKQNNNFEKE